MKKDFYKGVLTTLVFLFLFGIVFAVGFHTASEITPGTFQGDYVFEGNVKFNNSVSICDLTQEGSIRYNGTGFQGCNGSNWNKLGDVPVVLDPGSLSLTDKSANIAVSGNVASALNDAYKWGSIDFAQIDSGKYYLEFQSSGGSQSSYYFGVGVIPKSVSMVDAVYNQGNQGTDGLQFYMKTSPTTDTLMVALDMDNRQVWFGINGVWNSGNPSTGISPSFTLSATSYKFVYLLEHNTYKGTLKSLSGEYAYTIPTGFNDLSGN